MDYKFEIEMMTTELLKLQKEIKRDLIIDKDGELVIYDSYIE